jgi:hypothetical protein
MECISRIAINFWCVNFTPLTDIDNLYQHEIVLRRIPFCRPRGLYHASAGVITPHEILVYPSVYHGGGVLV